MVDYFKICIHAAALFAAQTWLMLKLFFRDRQSVFWNYLFPVLLQVLFCSAFGGNDRELNLLFLSSLLLITVMSGSLYGVGIVIPSLRQAGIFRRYRVTPARGWMVVGPLVAVRFLVILSAVAAQILISIYYYRAPPQGTIISLATIILLGDAMFCLLSLIIANTAGAPHVANAMANVLLMPMMFLSGAITPLEKMPHWLQVLARMFPATYVVDTLRGNLLFGQGLADQAQPLLAMLGFTVMFLLIASRTFRWE